MARPVSKPAGLTGYDTRGGGAAGRGGASACSSVRRVACGGGAVHLIQPAVDRRLGYSLHKRLGLGFSQYLCGMPPRSPSGTRAGGNVDLNSETGSRLITAEEVPLGVGAMKFGTRVYFCVTAVHPVLRPVDCTEVHY